MYIQLSASAERQPRQDIGRYLYFQDGDGPVEAIINGVRHYLEPGMGVQVPEGFKGWEVTNKHGATQWVRFDVSPHLVIDNRTAGSVTVTGSVDIADAFIESADRQGMLALQRSVAPEVPNDDHMGLDFSVIYHNAALTSAQMAKLAFIVGKSNANFPYMIFIDRVEYQASGKHCLGRDEGVNGTNAATPISGHTYTYSYHQHQYNGASIDGVFPAVGSGTRQWIQSDVITGSLSQYEKVDGYAQAGGDGTCRVWTPPVPICIANVTEAAGTAYHHLGIYLDNLEASSSIECWMNVYGRIVPTSTGWTH